MAYKRLELLGKQFTYLTVISAEGVINGRSQWRVRCVCGVERVLQGKSLNRGHYKSCGCKTGELISNSNTKHGMSHHNFYAVWDTMIARCHRPSHKSYKNYGAVGIQVCERWKRSFINFRDDMLPSYIKGLQLDRIDGTKGYSPDNCRWVTPTQQARNTRLNVLINTSKGSMCISEAAETFNIGNTTILYRIAAGWPEDKLLITPDKRQRIIK